MIVDRGYSPEENSAAFSIFKIFQDPECFYDQKQAATKTRLLEKLCARRRLSFRLQSILEILNTQEVGGQNTQLRIFRQRVPTYSGKPGEQEFRNCHVHFIIPDNHGFSSQKNALNAASQQLHELSDLQSSLLSYYLKPRTKYVEPVAVKSISKDTIDTLMVQLANLPAEKKIHELILVLGSDLTPPANQNLKTQAASCELSLFPLDNLLMPVNCHILHSSHTRLTQEEAQKLEQEMGIPRSRLPLLRFEDPVCQHYNWQAGDVIRVVRYNDYYPSMTPYSIQYRVVTRSRQ